MSFTAPNTPPAAAEADKTITNHAFFPAISLLAFRRAMRVDNVTSVDRAENALQYAVIETNQRLRQWMLAQQAKGYASLGAVPEQAAMPEGTNAKLYLRAVYSLAKADLIEKYRDYDATNSGHQQADELEPSIDEHRRNAAWAINDLTYQPRTTVDLI